jgi:protein gp37
VNALRLVEDARLQRAHVDVLHGDARARGERRRDARGRAEREERGLDAPAKSVRQRREG